MSDRFSCPHDASMIREHEKTMALTSQILSDFIVRYEGDRKECSERYRNDREEAREWRSGINARMEHVDAKLLEISTFLYELKPNYRRAIVLSGIITLGAFGLIWKMVWDRVVGK